MRVITLIFSALFCLPNLAWADCDLITKFAYKTKGLEVAFDNQSIGKYSEVIWNFGDGTNSTTNASLHKYATPGEYKFSVSVKTSEGCSSTYEGKVYVFDNTSEAKTVQPVIVAASVKNDPKSFSNNTTIEFSVLTDSNVQVGVYDLNGKLVKNVVSGKMIAGKQVLPFNAEGLPAGMYLVSMKADDQVVTHKITVL